MNIKFNSDENLSFSKQFRFLSVAIIVRSVFEEMLNIIVKFS